MRLFIETLSAQLTGPMFGVLRADSREAVQAATVKLVAGLQASWGRGATLSLPWVPCSQRRGLGDGFGVKPAPFVTAEPAARQPACRALPSLQQCLAVMAHSVPLVLGHLLRKIPARACPPHPTPPHHQQALDAFIRLHGSAEGGDFFLGGAYSMAETCTTGFVQRGLAVLPRYRGVDLWGLVREHKLDRWGGWGWSTGVVHAQQQQRAALGWWGDWQGGLDIEQTLTSLMQGAEPSRMSLRHSPQQGGTSVASRAAHACRCHKRLCSRCWTSPRRPARPLPLKAGALDEGCPGAALCPADQARRRRDHPELGQVCDPAEGRVRSARPRRRLP